MKSRRSSQTSVVSLPQDALVQTLSDLVKRVGYLLSSFTDAIASRLPSRPSLRSVFSRFGRRSFSPLPWKKYLPKILLVGIVIGVLITAGSVLRSQAKPSDGRIDIKGPIATLTLNREFSFPIKDDKGKELSRLKYEIESADLRNEIIVNGQRAVAVKGRRFLVLTIKLTNNYDKALQVNVRDYVRLSVGGKQQELLAADIHNDPVSIQAISTKPTRVGFPISDTEKDIVLVVGEISGQKEKIPLQF